MGVQNLKNKSKAVRNAIKSKVKSGTKMSNTFKKRNAIYRYERKYNKLVGLNSVNNQVNNFVVRHPRKTKNTLNKLPLNAINSLIKNLVEQERQYLSKVSSCKFEKINAVPCTSNTMGGHAGAFINVPSCKDGDNTCSKKVYLCGKKYTGDSVKELAFYQKLQNMAEKKQIPKEYLNVFPKLYTRNTNSMCRVENTQYFYIENLKSTVGGNAKTLDFKIGHRSARRFNSGFMKNKRHEMIDSLSTSKKLGFRLEGGNVSKNKLIQNNTTSRNVLIKNNGSKNIDKVYNNSILRNYKSLSNYKIKVNKTTKYKMNPYDIFNTFFNEINNAKKIRSQLNDIWNTFMYPNYKVAKSIVNNSNSNKKAVGFIGSSVLFVTGNTDTTVKLIDFAHPHVMGFRDSSELKKSKFEVIKDMTSGFRNLLFILDIWIASKLRQKLKINKSNNMNYASRKINKTNNVSLKNNSRKTNVNCQKCKEKCSN